jgi:hypothetical protein
VTQDGGFDSFDFKRMADRRAVVLRKDFMHASSHIDKGLHKIRCEALEQYDYALHPAIRNAFSKPATTY